MIALIWSGFSPLSLLVLVTISLLYYIRRGTCKFGYKFHHLKQGGSSVALQIWHENLGYGMTLRDEIDGKVAAMGLDPSKHIGKEITSLLAGYMGVVDVAKKGNMKH
ncbi:unnamed protein product [Prunus armeniaca]